MKFLNIELIDGNGPFFGKHVFGPYWSCPTRLASNLSWKYYRFNIYCKNESKVSIMSNMVGLVGDPYPFLPTFNEL